MATPSKTTHTHPDPDVLTIACPVCVRRVADDQDNARWAEAPVRAVTWRCSYRDSEVNADHLTFTLDVKVPAGATGEDVDERYPDWVGEAFTLALPATVPIDWTSRACESMEVEQVTIGRIVDEPAAAPVPQPSLFEATP